MPRMFGTSGIRGVINQEISPELCLKIGACFGKWLCENTKTRPQVVVGYDTRYGSDILASSAIAGLASQGIDVSLLGCVPTGAFSTYLSYQKYDGGILITGSHMPPDRTGIIAFLSDGSYAPYDVTDIVEEYYKNYHLHIKNVPPEKIGVVHIKNDAIKFYIQEMLKLIDVDAIKKREFRVLFDPGNGTGCYVVDFYKSLNCQMIEIHNQPSPYPQRHAEPRANTVQKAIEMVIKQNCDVGICLDTDADRVLFIDENGQPLSEDTAGAIFCKYELKKGDKAVFPVNSSGLIEFVCKEIGVQLDYCRIGQPETIKAVKQMDAKFSYEESGKYYFCRHNIMWSDGVLAGAKMLEILAKTQKPLSFLVSQFPKYYQVKHTKHVEDHKKEEIMQKIELVLEKMAIENRVKDYKIDGLKRVYADNSWLIIRKSGTEPLIRIYSDAPSLQRATELVEIGEKIFQEATK